MNYYAVDIYDCEVDALLSYHVFARDCFEAEKMVLPLLNDFQGVEEVKLLEGVNDL